MSSRFSNTLRKNHLIHSISPSSIYSFLYRSLGHQAHQFCKYHQESVCCIFLYNKGNHPVRCTCRSKKLSRNTSVHISKAFHFDSLAFYKIYWRRCYCPKSDDHKFLTIFRSNKSLESFHPVAHHHWRSLIFNLYRIVII